MSTVADLIAGSFRVLGVLAADETPSASEQTNAFNALNDMLDSWANDCLALYSTVRSTYTLIQGHNPHTIGTGGDFDTTRPIRIDRASLVLASSSNSELPISIVSDHEWQVTQGKATTGKPVFLWYETAFPLAKIWLNPIPAAADSLILYTWQPIGRFAATSSAVSLPPGYLKTLRYNLARELAPEYGVQMSGEAMTQAEESLQAIKRGNARPNYLFSDPSLLHRGPFNIISGDKG